MTWGHYSYICLLFAYLLFIMILSLLIICLFVCLLIFCLSFIEKFDLLLTKFLGLDSSVNFNDVWGFGYVWIHEFLAYLNLLVFAEVNVISLLEQNFTLNHQFFWKILFLQISNFCLVLRKFWQYKKFFATARQTWPGACKKFYWEIIGHKSN